MVRPRRRLPVLAALLAAGSWAVPSPAADSVDGPLPPLARDGLGVIRADLTSDLRVRPAGPPQRRTLDDGTTVAGVIAAEPLGQRGTCLPGARS